MNLPLAFHETGLTTSMLGHTGSFDAMASCAESPAIHQAPIAASALALRLEVGDVVFIRIPFKPFREVAEATGAWTNHVGIVVAAGDDPVVAESRFPLSGRTSLSRFVARSGAGRVAIARLKRRLSLEEKHAVTMAAERRVGVLYDTGFDLSSRRQFCSRFVREVLHEATGIQIGEVETFAQLLARKADANFGFWRLWYFGCIPWERETVTPAALLHSPALAPMFDGFAVAK